MPEPLMQILSNRVFLVTVAAWLLGQGSKMIIEIIKAKGEFSAERLTGSGGMPSAHSATVTALATGAALIDGLNSTVFAVAFFFAIVVIYDAMGVRRETGQQAKVLNALREERIQEGKDPLYRKPMETSMGHTLVEVIAGICLGIACAVIGCVIIPL